MNYTLHETIAASLNEHDPANRPACSSSVPSWELNAEERGRAVLQVYEGSYMALYTNYRREKLITF